MLLAEVVALGEVIIVGDNDSSLSLDGLHEETTDGLAVCLECLSQLVQVVVIYLDHTGHEGSEGGATIGVGGHGDDGQGAAVETTSSGDDDGLIGWDALLLVSPLSGQLDGCLYGLCARVHGKHHVVAEHFGGHLGEAWEDGIVERTRAQCALGGLIDHGLDDSGVTMSCGGSDESCKRKINVYLG